MAELRWIKTSLFLILVLQFPAAATGQWLVSITVRDGDEVTLPSYNSLIDDHKNCDSTLWIFYDSRGLRVSLVEDDKITDDAKHKSDRLSFSENCSLVIKNVTDEDGGRYDCGQIGPGQVAVFILSVVTMTEHKDTGEVTVNCSVSTYRCTHTVKWLLEGQDVDKHNKDLMTSQSSCSASLKVLTSHFFHTSMFNSLMCEVTEGGKVQKFPFRISPSGDETGWWRFIFVPVGVAALIIIVVAVNIWARMKEKKSQTDEVAVRYDAEDETMNYENIGPHDGV